jgi:membrane protein YdbS with pleckstrin-like domain
MKGLKKVTSYILIAFVLIITIISLLGIWDIISLEDVMRKIFTSLFIIFVASVIVLFIFSVLIRDSEHNKE